MKLITLPIFDIQSRLRSYFLRDGLNKTSKNEDPFRSDLYGYNQMIVHGKIVAQNHKLQEKKSSNQLLKRLDENERILIEVRNLLVENIRSRKIVTPGAEWVLDNFYLIEEQVVIARKHLPKGYSEGLPYLLDGLSNGMPRVYDIVLEIISHSDGRVDMKGLSSFIASYQSITLLSLGELWAIPIMLRLAVIENLRRVSVIIALDMIEHNLACYWADKMITTIEEEPEDLILTIAEMAKSKPLLSSSFVAGFTQKLQGKGPILALPLSWMEQKLAGLGESSGDLVQQENQKQAANQVSVRNSIGTLRFIGATDWREFVEMISSVEQLLRKDKTGTYAKMDFSTRDRYRHIVEGIAKFSSFTETEVAEKVVELVGSKNENEQNFTNRDHVGYFLIDKGLAQLEKEIGVHYPFKQRCVRLVMKMPLFLYLFSLTVLTGISTYGLFHFTYQYSSLPLPLFVFINLLFILGSSQMIISMINWLATMWVKPKLLPRMDFSKGIPVECRTMVVVPTMLSSKEYVGELLESLEIRYLANRESNLYFGLLTDFPDSNLEIMPEDSSVLALAIKGIEELNLHYTLNDQDDIFFLFHRPRTWNANENKWMGYERKRGKLSALNKYLLTRNKNDFSTVTGYLPSTYDVRYVITLDSDTQLPREAAWKLIATMAHPLNRAKYNIQEKRVTEGYGILQPRVASSIPKSSPSLYMKMQGLEAGIDPYTRVSSDVYQDVFGEGSFIGKGIYDVAIVEKTLHGVLQENRILSHDLLEGCYLRSGLISDVLLYEESPLHYSVDVKRHHRWIRGDWQIGAWMLPFVTGGNGSLKRNTLSILSRWKIFDNLRRSLMSSSLLLVLLLGWTILPYPWFWTLSVTFIILLAVMASVGWQLVNKPIDITLNAHFLEIGATLKGILMRFVFDIAVLPYEAFTSINAILLTNWRMIVTHKKLLEWTPSSITSENYSVSFLASYKAMWIAPFLGVISICFFVYVKPETLIVAFPMLTLWLIAPAIAWWLSKPTIEKPYVLKQEQLLFLNKIAFKTWMFFENFVTEEENWLPPDNFQEQPIATIAHRTSPTNMGMALLANLSAYDFGYISINELLQRSEDALTTMFKLERYQGHFYNWYDTLSLLPLQPRYVSTVDSGNLAGHLLTLRQGLLALENQPVVDNKLFQGLSMITMFIQEHSKNRTNEINLEKIQRIISQAEIETSNSLTSVLKIIDELLLISSELKNNQLDSEDAIALWITQLVKRLTKIKAELLFLTPWLALPTIPIRFNQLILLNSIPTLNTIRDLPHHLAEVLEIYPNDEYSSEEKEWLVELHITLEEASQNANEKINLIKHIASQCEELSTMEYDFLFNKSTSLLRIGYNVDEQRKDESYYDLLASEARLAVFVAIAQGKLPQESWFSLGRLLTNSAGDSILLSWSGSMFEYLMPQLIMPSFENTMLFQTNKATVKRQIDYGNQRGIPWGISESGYNRMDANLNYQYRAFGVPGLGLKRGLEEDLVIAPYATMLALMVAPSKACTNLELLKSEGFEGAYGFFEAIDYTPSRLPRGKNKSIIKSYMAHHQGMSLLSLAYVLLNKPMQRRFLAELRFQASLLLLQERIPRSTIFYAHTADKIITNSVSTDIQLRKISTPATKIPEIQLLSNGRYQIMITNAGGGYSRWKNIAVSRWREDSTKDDRGIFCYIKDVETGNFWSNTYQPTLQSAKNYEVVFSPGHVEFRRKDYGIETVTEIVISPEDDAEMRRIKIKNRNSSVKVLEITSYVEIVLASQASDESHPAFSNLFVQTEIQPQHNAIFCTRRARSEDEKPPWMFHLLDVQGAVVEKISYETDRMQFIGRGKTLEKPQAMETELLSGKQGAVLDPVMAIRYRIILKPNQTAIIDLVYGITESKELSEDLMLKYKDPNLKDRAFELSWTHSQVMLRQINVTEADAQLYDRLASSLIFINPSLRAATSVIKNNLRGQSGLWSHSVSGDLPILLLHIVNAESIDLVRKMVQAHAYWRLKGLSIDLVIWNEDHGTYRQLLQDQILGLINAETNLHNKPGSIFVKSVDQLSSEDRILFESVARVIIYDNRGSLLEQISKQQQEKRTPSLLELKPSLSNQRYSSLDFPSNLQFYNGTGGFTADGKEYKIWIDEKTTTPAPWVNVIANPTFGTVISETGSAYTWAINAHEYRLTPWNNDPVSDVGGEAFYIRDEETGYFWSPTAFPVKGATPYITTHGFGYSTFEHSENGIHSALTVFVDKSSPVKFMVLNVKNESGRERKLSATGFMEIILGDLGSKTKMHIISEVDSSSGSLLFRNRYNAAFANRVAYFNVNDSRTEYTTERSSFIGRNRNLGDPQALYQKSLSSISETMADPCAAFQLKFDLLDGSEKELIVQLGNEENDYMVNLLIAKFNSRNAVFQSLQEVKEYWKHSLDAVQIETPDKSLTILANGWLTYQTMACRLFARSGFYQSGGAFGFRDQLQDVLALFHTQPLLAREQLLLNASRQFVEGDVQHWWHPPEGRGVRTRCSDDLLWLPFVTSQYCIATGDFQLLSESVGYLESRTLNQDEDSLYDLPYSGSVKGTLYEHCVRSIKYSLRFGVHGLPLIGSGDWNDGMDLVGNKGKGESIWLAFFLYDVLIRFAETAHTYQDINFSATCIVEAAKLKEMIEINGWDGEWYKRAYFDDGTPLGSKVNNECRIDAIAQSWSVLSNAATSERKVIAMNSLDRYLVKRDLKLIQLLDPPFDEEGLNPGYIKGYVPGVRENGGQYSHAAIWSLMAFAALGQRKKVWELFSMVQPINHSLSPEDVNVYKVEPYVMAADVYANESHKGRGGWTWYTGSSGWMYQFIIGSFIGLKLENDKLKFNPCFPLDWPHVSVAYRYKNTLYKIKIIQLKTTEKSHWEMNNSRGEEDFISLVDDGIEREVTIYCSVN